MKFTIRLFLPLILLVAGCSTLGSGDIDTMRAIAQGRFDEIQAASLVFDKLIAQPAPSNLTPRERAAWDAQTTWLIRTKARLLSFNTSLRRVLDAPHPTGTGFDGALEKARLAADYAKATEDFALLIQELTVEAAEDERRVAEAQGTVAAGGGIDTTRVDSLGRKGIAVSTPLKTRHDTATSTITSLS